MKLYLVIFLACVRYPFATCLEDWNGDSYQNESAAACSRSSCPLWFYCKDGHCKPGEISFGGLAHFPGDEWMSVLDCYCVTFDADTCTAETGKCIFNCMNLDNSMDEVYHTLPDSASLQNDSLCSKFNRRGTLCGQCNNNSFPLAYSFDLSCVSCTDVVTSWVKFISIAFVPLTAFYFLIFLFKINIVSSHLYGFILYSQGICLPVLSRILYLACRNTPQYSVVVKTLGALYGIWNLDFFRSFDLGICLRTGTLPTLSLDIVVAVYPLMLMILSYVLICLYDRNYRVLAIAWRPFRVFSRLHKNWDIKTSLIDSFATFLLLSNVKFLSVAYDLLVPVNVYHLSPTGNLTRSKRLYYDASIHYFGSAHRPYALLAIAVLFIFVILPAALLLFYPLRGFQKLLNALPLRWHILHTFMDSFQGCYKNGTETGTRDWRWITSIYFLVRYFFFFFSAFVTGSQFFPLAAIVLSLVSLLLVLVQPFKNEFCHYSNITATYILFLALFYTSMTGVEFATTKRQDMMEFFYIISLLFACLPLIYVFLITFQWILARRKFGMVVFRTWQARRQGYMLL
jgi:hypothetical protein